ncbi:MAG: hypothetical protein ACLUGW_01220 [Oscillospiraceae bacterium]
MLDLAVDDDIELAVLENDVEGHVAVNLDIIADIVGNAATSPAGDNLAVVLAAGKLDVIIPGYFVGVTDAFLVYELNSVETAIPKIINAVAYASSSESLIQSAKVAVVGTNNNVINTSETIYVLLEGAAGYIGFGSIEYVPVRVSCVTADYVVVSTATDVDVALFSLNLDVVISAASEIDYIVFSGRPTINDNGESIGKMAALHRESGTVVNVDAAPFIAMSAQIRGSYGSSVVGENTVCFASIGLYIIEFKLGARAVSLDTVMSNTVTVDVQINNLCISRTAYNKDVNVTIGSAGCFYSAIVTINGDISSDGVYTILVGAVGEIHIEILEDFDSLVGAVLRRINSVLEVGVDSVANLSDGIGANYNVAILINVKTRSEVLINIAHGTIAFLEFTASYGNGVNVCSFNSFTLSSSGFKATTSNINFYLIRIVARLKCLLSKCNGSRNIASIYSYIDVLVRSMLRNSNTCARNSRSIAISS